MEEAVSSSIHALSPCSFLQLCIPMMPFPMPLMTPDVEVKVRSEVFLICEHTSRDYDVLHAGYVWKVDMHRWLLCQAGRKKEAEHVEFKLLSECDAPRIAVHRASIRFYARDRQMPKVERYS